MLTVNLPNLKCLCASAMSLGCGAAALLTSLAHHESCCSDYARAKPYHSDLTAFKGELNSEREKIIISGAPAGPPRGYTAQTHGTRSRATYRPCRVRLRWHQA